MYPQDKAKGRVGEVYNIGGHNEMRNIYIVKLICKEDGNYGYISQTEIRYFCHLG